MTRPSDPHTRLLADCLEDYHRRRALREPTCAEDYRERLGDAYLEFIELLAARSTLDEGLAADTGSKRFPRPFGHYLLLRELGGGAMGIVYEAVHRELGRKVALKVLRTGFDSDPHALERFRLEARACAQVRHESIVEIYEAGMAEDRPFYAMPILTGESLAQLIRAGRTPPPVDLCRGLAGIADALDALHRAGIIHRDVKPANIMVDPDGRMILADFGLARTAASQALTQTGQALGTPLYMSPEQIVGRKEDIDGRTDVYGLGVTLYEALSGQPPFKADGLHNIVRMVLHDRPKPLAVIAPQLPREVCFIAMKAVERSPRDRYQTAGEMCADLRNFSRGLRVAGRPVAPWRSFVRRHRWRLVATAVLLLAAGVAWSFWNRRPGTLALTCYPEALAQVAGAAPAPTPLRVRLPPGRHEILLRQEGFLDRTVELRLAAGERRTLEVGLVARETDDPRVLDLLARDMEVSFPPPTLKARHGETAERPPVVCLWPRGRVRKADLATFRVDASVPGDQGTVEFRLGTEVFWQTTLAPWTGRYEAAFAEEAAEILKPGDQVTWRFRSDSGAEAGADFEVVGEPEGSRLAGVEQRLRDQPETLRCHFRARVLLDADLPLAAYREAQKVFAAFEHSPRALAVAQEALAALGLEHTAPWSEVAEEIHELTDEARRAAFTD